MPKNLAETGRASNEVHEAYTTLGQPCSFGGKQHVVKKFGKRKAERYLIGQEAYTLHKDVRKRFVRCKTLSKGIGDLFQADLVDLTNISSTNDGVRYLLTCIDVLVKRPGQLYTRKRQVRWQKHSSRFCQGHPHRECYKPIKKRNLSTVLLNLSTTAALISSFLDV